MLPLAVETATALMGADFGNIQLVDPRDGSLVLVTQSGFGSGFLDHFAVVSDDGSVCGQAARQSAQAVVADVREGPTPAPHQKVFRAAGVRAVQSTPLVDHAGRLIGMISTHAAQPGRPSDRDLRLMELYAGLMGRIVAGHLGRTSDATDGPTRSSLGAMAPAWADLSSIDPLTRQILSDTVNRIFSAGLHFAGTLQLLTEDGVAARRVQAGIDELDETIHSIQRAALDLSTSHGPRGSEPVQGGRGPDIPSAASSQQQATAPS
ncbi:GAF domain-containing protein [Streptomyces sp. NPDC050548]|uniref:GAF domain-containing protein n=1 Tax=Streptomyces sp. NPDC050548 TaxID=3365629 RepID=UPI0037A22E36